MEKGELKKYQDIASKVEQLKEPMGTYGAVSFNAYEQAFISQRGLPVSTLKSISSNLKLNNMALADIFEMSEKTLRTRMKKEDKLKTSEADLALSLMELVSEGMATFEDKDNFLSWLNTPWEAMGHQKPAVFLKSVSGVKYLIDELRSIRHGVFA